MHSSSWIGINSIQPVPKRCETNGEASAIRLKAP
jgi:hypothetical protein